MKKLYLLFIVWGLMISLFSACSDDCDCIPYQPEPEVPTAPVVTITNSEYTMLLTDSIVFRANITSELPATYLWTIGGQEVSTDSIYVFKADAVGVYTLQVTVTNEAGNQIQSVQVIVKEITKEETPEGKYKNGTFILNEGLIGTYGSLIFINPDGNITDNVYFRENGKRLWSLTQDLFIHNNKMYIIAQKGDDASMNYGAITILNAETLKEVFSYSFPPELGFTSPTHIAVLGEDNIYIRDENSISVFHPSDLSMTRIAGTEKAHKNTMAVVDGKLFAAIYNQKSLVVIEKGKTEITTTIEFDGNVSGIIKSSDDKLWVSDESGKISKVDPNSYEIIASNQLTGEAAERLKLNPPSSQAAAPHITAKGDTLYMSATKPSIYFHIFSKDTTALMVDATQYIPASPDYFEAQNFQAYNTCAVDPVTGRVFLNTLKGWGGLRHNNHISIFDFTIVVTYNKYTKKYKNTITPRLCKDYANYLDYPANIYFTHNFQH